MKKFQIDFKFRHVTEVIDGIKGFINKNRCSEFEADISPLNLIDAIKTVVMCSTYHFRKYPEGKVYWDLKDRQTMSMIAPLKLSNMELRVKREEVKARLRVVK